MSNVPVKNTETKTIAMNTINGIVEPYTYNFNTVELHHTNFASVMEMYTDGKEFTPVDNVCVDPVTHKSFPLYNVGDVFVFNCDHAPHILQSPIKVCITKPMFTDARYCHEFQVIVSVSEDKKQIHVARCGKEYITPLHLMEELYFISE